MSVFFHISKTIYGRKLVLFQPKTKKNENEKCTFGRKRKWLKPLKIVILFFGAEKENELRSVSNQNTYYFYKLG